MALVEVRGLVIPLPESMERSSMDNEEQLKIKVFGDQMDEVMKQTKLLLPGAFIGVFAISESEGLVLAQFKCNMEHPKEFLKHLRNMCDAMLGGDVPTVDLRDVQGGMQ